MIKPYAWWAAEVTLIAVSTPRRSHFLSVFEALVKGAAEAAAVNEPLLWHLPQKRATDWRYQPGEEVTVALQLFAEEPEAGQRLTAQLAQRLNEPAAAHTHFVFRTATPWRYETAQAIVSSDGWLLEFLTPFHLKGTTDKQTVAPHQWQRAAQKRIAKLFGAQPLLPPVARIVPIDWQYWRCVHRSRSQNGNPFFLNGGVGRLAFFADPEWQFWLGLLAAVGTGDRLSFSLGRFLCTPLSPMATQRATPTSKETAQALYLTTPGQRIGLENGAVVVSGRESETQRHPLRLLSHLFVLAPATLTTAAIEACAEADVPILIATPKRRPVVLLGQRQAARKNRILAAQYRCWAALSETERAQIAAVWVRGKILRQQALIRSRYRAGDAAVLAALDEELRRLARCQRVAAVRGVEGSAARRYYPWLATQHAAWGRWQGRSRPAKDLLNALLNFGYTLLIPVVERWVRVEGLDPYLGALHSSAGRYPSLVFDVVEPFRAAVDRLILALWGRRQIDEADFLPDAASWRLSPDARRTFLLAFDKMVRGGERPLEQEIRSVVASLRQAIEHDQVREWVEKTYYF